MKFKAFPLPQVYYNRIMKEINMPIHIDEEGNVIPEEITPQNPGPYLKYAVSYPDTVDVIYYYFTDAQIMSIVMQYDDYQKMKKTKLYPK